jgi:hypothetical protein
MSDRPYSRLNLDQLESLFEDAEDCESLEQIQDELRFRASQRALDLLRKVEESIKSKQLATVNSTKKEAVHTSSVSSNANRSPKHVQSQNEYKRTSIEIPLGGESKPSPDLRKGAFDDSSPTEDHSAAPEIVLTGNHIRLLDLLGYLEHLAKLGEKPVFRLSDYQQIAFAEEELKGQVGITHDLSSDEGQTWLRIARLQRTEPPVPPQETREWIVLSRDPSQRPKVQDVLTLTVTRPEADELLSSGKAQADDCAPSLRLRASSVTSRVAK